MLFYFLFFYFFYYYDTQHPPHPPCSQTQAEGGFSITHHRPRRPTKAQSSTTIFYKWLHTQFTIYFSLNSTNYLGYGVSDGANGQDVKTDKDGMEVMDLDDDGGKDLMNVFELGDGVREPISSLPVRPNSIDPFYWRLQIVKTAKFRESNYRFQVILPHPLPIKPASLSNKPSIPFQAKTNQRNGCFFLSITFTFFIMQGSEILSWISRSLFNPLLLPSPLVSQT